MINLMDRILEEYGLNYEDLNIEERNTYQQQAFNLKNITVEDIITYIRDMKNAVALQLTDVPDDKEHGDLNSKLKARLKNYILQEAFLTAPDKAEKALRESLKNVKKS